MITRFLNKVYVVVGALFCCGCMPFNGAVAAPPTTQPTASQLPVLSLPYHGEASAPPRSVSLFFVEDGIYVGRMLCSDKARNIYIYDRVSAKQCLIKKFDPQGKLLQVWPVKLHDLGDGVSAMVLSDGKVWFNLGVGAYASGEKSGLPFVVLQPGHSEPIVDWQQSLPASVTKLLYNSVTPEMWQGMPAPMKSQTRTWMITRLDSLGDKVLLDITNLGGGPTYYPPEAKITKSQKLSWQLLLSGDGKQLIQAKPMATPSAETSFSFRSPQGAVWHGEYDSPTRPQNWTKLWVWKEGQAKGVPLVARSTLSQPREAWQKLIGSQPQSPPFIFVDAKDNIYLLWRRKAIGPNRRFSVNKTSWLRDPMGEDYGQRALVVLDSNRKFVTAVPWTTCYYELDDWIVPVPDGSGFYRQGFGEKALNIYWYPLPHFKASLYPKPATVTKSVGGQTLKRK